MPVYPVCPFVKLISYRLLPLGVPIPSELTPGLNKDYPTKSVLKIIPTLTDDRLKYSCLVHNRAISKENASEAQVLLNVHCKCCFPSLSLCFHWVLFLYALFF